MFIFIGAFILSVIASYFIGTSNKKLKKIVNIIYGCIFGFFLFKSIFYYIIFYFSLKWILYLSFFFTFIILGAIAGFIIINYFSHLDTYFFIACSVMPGSFYIIKGISFIIGGYYSDIITIKFELKFKADAKMKINFYLILQILLIIFFVLYHLFYYFKYKELNIY